MLNYSSGLDASSPFSASSYVQNTTRKILLNWWSKDESLKLIADRERAAPWATPARLPSPRSWPQSGSAEPSSLHSSTALAAFFFPSSAQLYFKSEPRSGCCSGLSGLLLGHKGSKNCPNCSAGNSSSTGCHRTSLHYLILYQVTNNTPNTR